MTVSMFEQRDPRIDLLALALGGAVVFLALSLVTHNACDPPVELASPFNRLYEMRTVTYPLSEDTSNACGRWGALTSAMLFDAFGYAAYFVVGSLAALVIVLLHHRSIDSILLRTVGWTASLVGITALLSMSLPWSPAGSLMGAGGQLGALVGGLLEFHFARIGGFVLATSLLVGGLLLSTDYVLLRIAMVAATLLIALTAQRRRRRSSRRVDGAEVVGGETLAMRLRGKNAQIENESDVTDETDDDEDDVEQVEYEEDEYDEEEGYDEEDEEVEPAEEVRRPISIKKPNIAMPSRRTATAGAVHNAGAPIPAGKAATSSGSNRRRRLAALRIHQAEKEVNRDEVMEKLDEASEREDHIDYDLPSRDLLIEADDFSYENQEREVLKKAKLIDKTFQSFGYDVRVVDIEMGPVIAQYELELQEGLRLNKITALADDLAIALRVPSVRIVAPIPGKNTVGIEVPNAERQLVRLREVMEKTNGRVKKMGIPLFLGKDVSGSPLTVDLAKLPHLLIAGRTGTGKSVCLNAIITSMLMTRRPDEVRMLMIDPKMVELSGYGSLPHLMHPVVTDMRKAEAILAWAVEKMEERYALLARAGVRHMKNYNSLSEEEIMERLDPQSQEERDAIPLNMPYIVIVADEMADLMMTAGKEVQTHIIRLAQKSRAVGIHLILATQKPTVDVITGLIKSNLPARIAFQVASRTDSRVVLDEMGADKLLGNGDMLFLSPGTSTLIRGQGTFLSDDEINAVVDQCSTGEQNFVTELVNLKVDDGSGETSDGIKNRDDLYEQAVEVVIREGRGSISLLQRSLGIGYGRAARIVDFMAEDGIVGPYAGSKTRQVVVTMEDWNRMKNAANGRAGEPAALPTASVSPITRREACGEHPSSRPSGDINDFVDNLIESEESGDDPVTTSTRPSITAFASMNDDGAVDVADEDGCSEEKFVEDGFEDDPSDNDVDDEYAVAEEGGDLATVDVDEQCDQGYDDHDEEEHDEEEDDEEEDDEEDHDEEPGNWSSEAAEEYEYDEGDGDVDDEYEYVEVDDVELSEGELPEDDEYEYVYEDVEDEYEVEELEDGEFEDEDLESEDLESEDLESEDLESEPVS